MVTTGASFAAETVTSRVATLLRLSTAPPSSAWKLSVRVAVVGLSAVLS